MRLKDIFRTEFSLAPFTYRQFFTEMISFYESDRGKQLFESKSDSDWARELATQQPPSTPTTADKVAKIWKQLFQQQKNIAQDIVTELKPMLKNFATEEQLIQRATEIAQRHKAKRVEFRTNEETNAKELYVVFSIGGQENAVKIYPI
jgi:hypothetical protein